MKTKEKKTTKEFTFPVTHSEHSRKRANQRGITEEHIQTALNFSEMFFKQGMIFHAVKTKNIPDDFDPKIRKRIEDLIIVIAGDSDMIITCYWAKNPMRLIKKKSCNLQKYKMAG
jgi:hypothetical protein